MQCPKCQIPLVMSDRQGVEIDYCPQCRGVWLDRGELDKIIERSDNFDRSNDFDGRRNEDRDDDDRRYPPHGGDRGNYGHRKKKSFWSELFD